MKKHLPFILAFTAAAVFFFVMDAVIFGAQGLQIIFRG